MSCKNISNYFDKYLILLEYAISVNLFIKLTAKILKTCFLRYYNAHRTDQLRVKIGN